MGDLEESFTVVDEVEGATGTVLKES